MAAYQPLHENTTTDEGAVAIAINGEPPQQQAAFQPQYHPQVYSGAPQQVGGPPPYVAAMGQPGGPPMMAYPVGGVPPILVAGPPQLLMTMPVHFATSIKVAYAVLFTIILAISIGQFFYLNWWVPVFWMSFSIIINGLTMWHKLPVSCDVTTGGIVVHTRGSSYPLPWHVMAAIEVVRSTACFGGNFPRTKFTSNQNGIFFRVNTCGQSLAFSPLDINQMLLVLQRTPGNALLQYLQ